jgi:hypothetical protein
MPSCEARGFAHTSAFLVIKIFLALRASSLRGRMTLMQAVLDEGRTAALCDDLGVQGATAPARTASVQWRWHQLQQAVDLAHFGPRQRILEDGCSGGANVGGFALQGSGNPASRSPIPRRAGQLDRCAGDPVP